MATDMVERAGGRVLVDQLRIHGAELAFGVPGESYLAVLDALHDTPEVRYIVCRHEGAATIMAEAYGKLTGRPGIAMVTRGPGATNASSGVHIAHQDSTPLILLIGQVARDMVEREAFQEIDYRRMFGQMAKWVAQIDDPARIPEFMHRAFATATSGRPGPVVLALPEDMLIERCTVPDGRPYQAVEAHPSAAAMAELRGMLAAAERPLVILGGGGWNAEACADIQAFAEVNALPVATGFRRQDLVDCLSPCFAGILNIGPDPDLVARLDEADLLLVVGSRLSEVTTGGYTLIDIPRPRQRMIHVHAAAEELGRVYQPDLAIHAGVRAIAAALRAMPPVESPAWAGQMAEAHADYLAHIEPPKTPGALQMGHIMRWLRENLPRDAIVTNGAGNYSLWPNRFYPFGGFRTQLAPTAGSMGYGFPAALAAKFVHRERTAVCFAGDGCFMMNGQELATAVAHGLDAITLVVDNGMLGTIRMHQEREYPGRVSSTDLTNPDFAALARAYGAHGETVREDAEFGPAFERARASGKPAILHLLVDPEAISPRTTITELRTRALAAAG